jgi:nucleoside phosphorylase
MTFEQPTKADLDRVLSLLMHEARDKLLDQHSRITSDAVKAGSLQGNRVIITAAKAADTIHLEAMNEARSVLFDFIQRMQLDPAKVTSWARPHLENLGNSLLGCLPSNDFPLDHQRIRAQYQAVFQQRLNGTLRDVEIGFVKGAGFTRAERRESKDEWISASEAVQVPPALANQPSSPTPPVGVVKRRSAVVLTALHVETRTVLRHLTNVREQTVRGGTVFHYGRFDEWDVAVAECGEGNVRAAATIERAIAHFHPEVALFVGVAGGVKDVAIGDALVCSKVYGYERGKDTGDGFKPRPAVNLSAYALEQRARAVKLKNSWQLRLSPELKHSNPQIYIGAIAAGEKVVASSVGKIAEFLRETYGDTLGVEMEGQGFLAGVHINAPVRGCVIRGISDLLDGKMDADKSGSQGRAADVASAVAFEMLATLDPDEANANREVAAFAVTGSHQAQGSDEGAAETNLDRNARTFSDLCKQLKPLFQENGRLFRDFGPNSGRQLPHEPPRIVRLT